MDLRESEAKFATSFRVNPEAMYLMKPETGMFLEVNEGFERLTGYSSRGRPSAGRPWNSEFGPTTRIGTSCAEYSKWSNT